MLQTRIKTAGGRAGTGMARRRGRRLPMGSGLRHRRHSSQRRRRPASSLPPPLVLSCDGGEGARSLTGLVSELFCPRTLMGASSCNKTVILCMVAEASAGGEAARGEAVGGGCEEARPSTPSAYSRWDCFLQLHSSLSRFCGNVCGASEGRCMGPDAGGRDVATPATSSTVCC